MKTQLIILIVIPIILLSACVVQPKHRRHMAIVKAPVKAELRIKKEHSNNRYLMINANPKKKCRSHKRHWHCKR